MINLQNYEEWFLLYMDQELSESERKAVEFFLQQHPELQPEWDALQATILQPEDVVPGNWDKLEKTAIPTVLEETALRAIDGELSVQEEKQWQAQLAADSLLNRYYQELQRTRLPQEEIIFPDKASLLHKNGNRKVIPLWLKYMVSAAAVIAAVIWGFRDMAPKPAGESPAFAVAGNRDKEAHRPQDTVARAVAQSAAVPATMERIAKGKKVERNIAPAHTVPAVASTNGVRSLPVSSAQSVSKEKKNFTPEIPVVATVNTDRIKKEALPDIPVPLHTPADKVPLLAKNAVHQESQMPTSGKRMVMATSDDQDEAIRIANTTINPSRLLKVFRRNKQDRTNEEGNRKIAVANFEINVGTRQL